jgi:hypothetical protein
MGRRPCCLAHSAEGRKELLKSNISSQCRPMVAGTDECPNYSTLSLPALLVTPISPPTFLYVSVRVRPMCAGVCVHLGVSVQQDFDGGIVDPFGFAASQPVMPSRVGLSLCKSETMCAPWARYETATAPAPRMKPGGC